MALGSTDEVGAALDVAVAWDCVAEAAIAPALALLDRERAILWPVVHRHHG